MPEPSSSARDTPRHGELDPISFGFRTSPRPPRVLWHRWQPWLYTYRVGGFEGYVALFTRQRLAPDLRHYARWRHAERRDAR